MVLGQIMEMVDAIMVMQEIMVMEHNNDNGRNKESGDRRKEDGE